jgi:hypothetical protein
MTGRKGGASALRIEGKFVEMARLAREVAHDPSTGEEMSSHAASSFASDRGISLSIHTILSIWKGNAVEDHSLLKYGMAFDMDVIRLMQVGGYDIEDWKWLRSLANKIDGYAIPQTIMQDITQQPSEEAKSKTPPSGLIDTKSTPMLRVPSGYNLLNQQSQEFIQVMLESLVSHALTLQLIQNTGKAKSNGR